MTTDLELYITLNTSLLELVHSSSNDKAIRHLEYLVRFIEDNPGNQITAVLYHTAVSAIKVLKSAKILRLGTPVCVSCVDRVIHELSVLIDSSGIREDLLTVGSCSRLASSMYDAAGALPVCRIITSTLAANVGELRIGSSDITEDVVFVIEDIRKTLEDSHDEYSPMSIKYVSDQLDVLYHLLSLATRIE